MKVLDHVDKIALFRVAKHNLNFKQKLFFAPHIPTHTLLP